MASQTVSTELTSTMTETLADTRTVTFNVEVINLILPALVNNYMFICVKANVISVVIII